MLISISFRWEGDRNPATRKVLLNIKWIVSHRATHLQVGNTPFLRPPLRESFGRESGLGCDFFRRQKIADFVFHELVRQCTPTLKINIPCLELRRAKAASYGKHFHAP